MGGRSIWPGMWRILATSELARPGGFREELDDEHPESLLLRGSTQLKRGHDRKTGRGKITANDVIIQPQPKTDTEHGVTPALLIREL